jgi:hypothetical protein
MKSDKPRWIQITPQIIASRLRSLFRLTV